MPLGCRQPHLASIAVKVTRKMIAAAAGVSLSTVDMILSGSGERYRESTRTRVQRIAAEMGYLPSINARAMRLRRSLLFGVLLYDVNTHLAADFLKGVQQAIAATDYSPLVFFASSPAEQVACLARCRDRQVDGLLLNCTVDPVTGLADDIAVHLNMFKIPAVEIFGRFISAAPKVNVDNRESGAIAVRHLVGLGHRRIALVTHSRYRRTDTHFDAWEHACGYRDALASAGLEPMIEAREMDYDHLGDSTLLAAGFEALDPLLALPQAPTAVVCYDDRMAFGLNRACRAKGISVPDRLSICGNSGLTLSAITNPPITTIRPPYFEVGRTAAAKLLQILDGETPGDSLMAPELELRQSTTSPLESLG